MPWNGYLVSSSLKNGDFILLRKREFGGGLMNVGVCNGVRKLISLGLYRLIVACLSDFQDIWWKFAIRY